jgi:hypothetical protein
MTLTGYDAAYPPANPPETDVVAFYGGGDTPHVWTLAQIAAQKARYRLPIWVRSDPQQANAMADAGAFIAYLRSVGCPTGVCTVLDLEEAIDAAYVNAFGFFMRSAGYRVLPYGSSGFLFSDPVVDGYWVAKPGATSIPANCVGVQYLEDAGGGAYDLSWFLDTIPLWDTQPAPPLPPPTSSPRGADMLHTVPVRTDINGNGWVETTIQWADFMAVALEGSDPQTPEQGGDGVYWPGTVKVQDRNNMVLVTVTGFLPSVVANVFVCATA